MFSQKCGNAGNKPKCGISRTIAGWLTPMPIERTRYIFQTLGTHVVGPTSVISRLLGPSPAITTSYYRLNVSFITQMICEFMSKIL